MPRCDAHGKNVSPIQILDSWRHVCGTDPLHEKREQNRFRRVYKKEKKLSGGLSIESESFLFMCLLRLFLSQWWFLVGKVVCRGSAVYHHCFNAGATGPCGRLMREPERRQAGLTPAAIDGQTQPKTGLFFTEPSGSVGVCGLLAVGYHYPKTQSGARPSQ